MPLGHKQPGPSYNPPTTKPRVSYPLPAVTARKPADASKSPSTGWLLRVADLFLPKATQGRRMRMITASEEKRWDAII